MRHSFSRFGAAEAGRYSQRHYDDFANAGPGKVERAAAGKSADRQDGEGSSSHVAKNHGNGASPGLLRRMGQAADPVTTLGGGAGGGRRRTLFWRTRQADNRRGSGRHPAL